MGADAEAPDAQAIRSSWRTCARKALRTTMSAPETHSTSTIVRPGLLTDDPGTGRVTIADETRRGSIPREDVAAVLLAVLDTPGTGGQTFEVISGDTPINEAVTTSTRE